jgi:arginase
MPKPLAIIGAPSSAGAFAPGQEQAPSALREAGLVERLRSAGVAVTDYGDTPVWRWRPDRERPRAQNLPEVVSQAEATAARVREAVAAGHIPLVLGGDCTIELGTVAGFLPTERRIGLLYFDLHADLNVPESVPEGALDWMGVAHLLGEEKATTELSRLGPRFPLLEPSDVCIFGHGPNRATAWEREVMARREIRTIPIADVAGDPEGAGAAALAHFADYDRLLVHFDVDVIDFTDAPLSENTGRNEGLTVEQAFRALYVLVASPAFAALTITELNPDHGEEDGATLERFVARLVNVLVSSPTLAWEGAD